MKSKSSGIVFPRKILAVGQAVEMWTANGCAYLPTFPQPQQLLFF
jgi:hypothetical protein